LYVSQMNRLQLALTGDYINYPVMCEVGDCATAMIGPARVRGRKANPQTRLVNAFPRLQNVESLTRLPEPT
jgi:hypothetical protein